MLQNYQRILAPIDGSDQAYLAFKKAVEVAKRNNAELYLLHVIDTRAYQNVVAFDSVLASEAADRAKSDLEEYIAYAKENGVENVDYIIEFGSPKHIIGAQIPVEKEIDLIMIGATGLNMIERLLIGSVSEYVIRHANCDVMVIRTDLDNNLPEPKEE